MAKKTEQAQPVANEDLGQLTEVPGPEEPIVVLPTSDFNQP